MHTVFHVHSLAARGRLVFLAGALATLLAACSGAGNTSGNSGQGSVATSPPPGVDTTAPTVSLSSPGGTVSGTLTLNASASDNVGVAGVKFLLDGGMLIGAEDTSAPYSVSWNTSTTSNGMHILTAVARDAAGNLTTSSAVTVTVSNSAPPLPGDTTKPTVSFTAPAAGATVSGGVTVSANASDNVGVVGVQFLVDGNLLLADDTSAPYTFSWNSSGASNGSHTLSAVARDAAGNLSVAATRTITVSNDVTAPTVSISAPTAGSTVSGTVTISAAASDNVGVVGVQFKLNGANLGAENTTTPYTVSWDTTSAANASYTLTAVARDAAGNTKTSTAVNVTVNNAPPSGTATFPLRVESGKHYLIDAAGKPFFMHGEAAWGLIVQLTREEVDQYLNDRLQKGINTILVMLVAKHVLISNSPHNAYGDAPFLTSGDFSTPNETYFAHADWVINRATQKGFLILLVPSYTGYQGDGQEGWYPEMQANGVSKLRSYGQYVGNRYKGFSNLLWLEGGDFNPPNTAGKDLIRAVANGIRDMLPQSLQTFHGSRNTAAMQFWGTTAEPWLSVNDIYTDENTIVAAAHGEYARSTAPFFLAEARYENESADEGLVRTQAFQAILGGAFGHVMGNKPMWGFMSGWQSALDSPAARTIKYLRTLMEARAWWMLQPDTTATLLTSGISGYADEAVAARASDGSFAITYMPSVRTVTIDLTKLNGPKVNARWCDPTNGVCTTASGSPFPATGSQAFLPPGPNSTNYGDWVLTLDSQQ